MNSEDKDLLIKLLESEEFSSHNQIIEKFYELYGYNLSQSDVSRFLSKKYTKYPKNFFDKGVYIPNYLLEERKQNKEFQEIIELSEAEINENILADYLLINYKKAEYKDILIKYIKIISPETVIIKTESTSLFLLDFSKEGLQLKKIRDLILTNEE